MDCSSFRSFQEISHIARAHVVGRFSIHGHNNVARTNASPIGRSSHKWSDDDNFVIARTHRYADALVPAALIFAQQGIGLWIQGIGMRVKRMEHPRNSTV